MKFQFLTENFSRSENAPPFETRKIRLFEVERIFLENKKMVQDFRFSSKREEWEISFFRRLLRTLECGLGAGCRGSIWKSSVILKDRAKFVAGRLAFALKKFYIKEIARGVAQSG